MDRGCRDGICRLHVKYEVYGTKVVVLDGVVDLDWLCADDWKGGTGELVVPLSS